VGDVRIPDLARSILLSILIINFNRAANSDRKKYKRQIAEQRIRHHSLQSEYEKLKEQKTTLASTATSTGELLSKCKRLISGTDRVRPQVEAKLQLYQDLKVTTDDFVAWTSELNNQAESVEILGRSDKALENGIQRIIDALVSKEQAEVRKICAPLFVHATSPPPGARSSNSTEDKVGAAIALAFICIILFIQLDLGRMLWLYLLKDILRPERHGLD